METQIFGKTIFLTAGIAQFSFAFNHFASLYLTFFTFNHKNNTFLIYLFFYSKNNVIVKT